MSALISVPQVFEESLFGCDDPSLVKLPQPPWPYYFYWARMDNSYAFKFWLYLRRLATAVPA